MRKVLCVSVALAALSLMSGEAIAQTASPYQQLLQTRDCMGCNLSNLDLKGLDLAGANLQNANLSNANLSGANLSGANLSGADLYLSTLGDANLSQARLDNANIRSGNFSNATLSQSSLLGVTATYANFSNANFSGAVLSNSNFSDADLTGADFSSASVVDSKFNNARLDQANMASASVQDTSFQAASTEGTIFPTANSNGLVSETPNLDARTTDLSKNEDTSNAENIAATGFDGSQSPLANISFQSPTAQHLKKGEVLVQSNLRVFDITKLNAQGGDEGTPFWPSLGVRWGITDDSQLSVAFQNFDAGSLEAQGAFDPFLVDEKPTFDFAIQFKQKIWKNSAETLSLSGEASLAGFTEPRFAWQGANLPPQEGNGLVPSIAFPLTATIQDKLNVTVAPTIAFFQNDSALFLSTLPLPASGSFGTTVGLSGAISYQLHPRLLAWGDAFFPFTGNNSISLSSGLPAKTLAFNAGVRYLLNPRVGVDVFATNTFGTFGPVSLTADRNNLGFGIGFVALPGVFPSNRDYPNTFDGQYLKADTPLTMDGFGFFDGGTVPEGKLIAQVQGGSHGIMSALRLGVVRDFELGTYLDYVFGSVDESEQGVAAKFRFLNQDDGAPFTLSAAASLGVGNEPIINIRDNDAQAFVNGGGEKSVPFLLGGQLSEGGGLYTASASLPIHYNVADKLSVWATPTLGFVQRRGLLFAGLNLGASMEVIEDLSVLAEVGATFRGDGNAFINNRLVDRIPWNVGVRWQPSNLFGTDFSDKLARPSLELFVTNRVGSSTFQQMRVREGNDPAVGVGLTIPFF